MVCTSTNHRLSSVYVLTKHVIQSVHSDKRSDRVQTVRLSKLIKMDKTKELSKDKRQNIIKLHKDGKGY